ncbi:hypothetical protein CP8484711_1484B, partial [Chlamydia psittaci 84-8471/1]
RNVSIRKKNGSI